MRPFSTLILATSFLTQSSFAQHQPGGIYDDFAFGSVYAGGWDVPEYLYDAVYTARVTKTKYVCPCDPTASLTTAATAFTTYATTSGNATITVTGSASSLTGTTTSGTSLSATTTSSNGTLSTTSSVSISSTLTSTASNTTINTHSQTSTYVPVQTGTFNLKAYGNPFVADGTSLGDVFVVRSDYPNRGFGIFDNGNTNLYVDSNNALIDQQTGGQACVNKGDNPAVIRFATPAYLQDNTTADYGKLAVCACQAPTVAAATCLCDGKSQFAVDYRSYLYIQTLVASTTLTTSSASSTLSLSASSSATIVSANASIALTTTTTTPPAKRSLEVRQVTSTTTTLLSSSTTTTSASSSNTATTPIAVTVSATSASTTVSATTCQTPLQTINIVSNGSTINPNATGPVYTYPDGAYVKQSDWDTTNHWQYAGFQNGSFYNASNPYLYGGNFTYDPCSGLIQETTYGRIMCTGPSKRTFGPLFVMPYDKIIADGGDLCVCKISSTQAITCQCGPGFQFQTSNDGQLWVGAYSAANYANNYPKAVVLG